MHLALHLPIALQILVEEGLYIEAAQAAATESQLAAIIEAAEAAGDEAVDLLFAEYGEVVPEGDSDERPPLFLDENELIIIDGDIDFAIPHTV